MFQESIMKKIARMTEVTREEVRSKHKELVNVVKKDVERLEKVTSITEKNLKTLNNVKGQSDTKVFTNIKNIEKFAKDAEIFVNDLSSKLPIRKLDYCIDYESPHNDTSLKTFGHFTEDENKPANILQLSERYKGVFDVKLESDEKDCTISGICVLENGMYVISDFANRKLKRFNRNYELYDSIKLIGAPTSACLSGSQQVVVALCDKKLIQFVSCSDKLSVDYSFSTIDNCNGVFFDSENNELVICCSSSICIYNKTGTLLKLIENDETGEHLFSDVKNCVLMPGSETIYSVDVQKGLIASTKDGKKLWTFNNTKLEKPWSICLISCQHLLVACSLSCIILQVSKDGIFISESTSESHREEIGMNKLYTLVYDKRHSTVSLGGTSNEICTYRLCRK